MKAVFMGSRCLVVAGLGLMLALSGCKEDDSVESRLDVVSAEETRVFVEKVKGSLVFTEGGEFLMGDFGPEYAPEHLPYDMEKHSRPLHKVELDSYSIGRYKISNAEFQFYLKSNGLQLREKGVPMKKRWDQMNSLPNTPAHVDWYEAKKYCDWLATVTEYPFALPTEAQWEYAARSRGRFLMVATDDGTYKAEPRYLMSEDYDPKGINISSYGNRVEFGRQMQWSTGSVTPLPIDMFPPNPLGLYSMTDNGYEWVNDWYDPTYYARSPVKNPQGPEQPVTKDVFGRYTKVLRGQDVADPYWGGGANVFRSMMDPLGSIVREGTPYLHDKTARCVVNRATPVT